MINTVSCNIYPISHFVLCIVVTGAPRHEVRRGTTSEPRYPLGAASLFRGALGGSKRGGAGRTGRASMLFQ